MTVSPEAAPSLLKTVGQFVSSMHDDHIVFAGVADRISIDADGCASTLRQDSVAPGAIAFGDALTASDKPKAASRLERQTRRVSGIGDALQRPDAMVFGRTGHMHSRMHLRRSVAGTRSPLERHVSDSPLVSKWSDRSDV